MSFTCNVRWSSMVLVALPWFLYSIAACSVSPNVSHRAAHGYDESNRTSSSRQYSKRIQGNKGNDDDQGTDCGGCAADVL
ncbi:hypothetical protein BLIG_01010 [Bifidobacterium longum subsp. infantis CCUG 52486]|uniref:Secreted protein n=1 Tax=Bifidobacterium longum subsp. infantis CCUG 52486 TaxID=537937 RepID=C5EAL5_BIFLI|nr:hypothetical protein BLIG_01010 [Bifidobacterium longum subsp. infantis CCUG 52486]